MNLYRSFDGTYILYDNDGDTYFKAFSLEEYLKELKTHFTDIFEELKNKISSWKVKLILGLLLEYDDEDKKFETEIFIHNFHEQTIMLQSWK